MSIYGVLKYLNIIHESKYYNKKIVEKLSNKSICNFLLLSMFLNKDLKLVTHTIFRCLIVYI